MANWTLKMQHIPEKLTGQISKNFASTKLLSSSPPVLATHDWRSLSWLASAPLQPAGWCSASRRLLLNEVSIVTSNCWGWLTEWLDHILKPDFLSGILKLVLVTWQLSQWVLKQPWLFPYWAIENYQPDLQLFNMLNIAVWTLLQAMLRTIWNEDYT